MCKISNEMSRDDKGRVGGTACQMEPSNTVQQFFEAMEPKFAWDLLPFSFLYNLYKSWFRQNYPNGTIQGMNSFIREIVSAAENSKIWCCDNPRTLIRANGHITRPEPLILQYDVREWMNPNYQNGDAVQAAMPVLKNTYRGLLRRADAPCPSGDSGCSPE